MNASDTLCCCCCFFCSLFLGGQRNLKERGHVFVCFFSFMIFILALVA